MNDMTAADDMMVGAMPRHTEKEVWNEGPLMPLLCRSEITPCNGRGVGRFGALP